MSFVEGVPTFHWADYLVLGLFVVFTTLLGLVIGYIDRRKATSKQFLMAGGDMHYIPVALSMQASFLSAIFILSTPTEVYYFGTMYWWMTLSYCLSAPISSFMFLPTFYRLKVTSAYEYLEMRFNRSVRVAGALTFMFMTILYMAVVLYSPAVALAQVTGLSVSVAISVSGGICIIYTVMGGMRATIWNDFTQMVVIGISLVVLLSLSAVNVGSSTMDICDAGGRIEFDNFDPDPTVRTTFWTQTIGGLAINVTLYSSSQTIIQKFLSIKKIRNAQKSMFLAAFMSSLFLTLVILIGLVMYAYYATCDPLLAGRVRTVDQMVPLFVMEILGHLHGLPGLFIAATFSAALSMNALAAVCLVDFVRPIYTRVSKKTMTELASNVTSRVLALLFGCLTIGLAFAAQFFGKLILQMALSIFGFVGGPLMGLLSLGIFFPFVNSWGALAGLLSSLGVCSWIAVGAIIAQVPAVTLPRSTAGCPVSTVNSTTTTAAEWTFASQYFDSSTRDFGYTTAAPSGGSDSVLWVYKISHMYYSVIAFIVAVIVGIVVSLITGRAKDTPAKLTFQWGNKCCCYCPRSVRDCLRCGAADTAVSDTDDITDNCDKESSTTVTAVQVNGFDVVMGADVTKSPPAYYDAIRPTYELAAVDHASTMGKSGSDRSPHSADTTASGGETKDSGRHAMYPSLDCDIVHF